MSAIPQLEERLRPYLAERASTPPPSGFEDHVLNVVRQRSNRRRALPLFNELLAAAAVLALAIGAAVGINYFRPHRTAPVTPPASVRPTASATPTASPTPIVFRHFSGTGSATTAGYSTGGVWSLSWSYDCSNIGKAGRFQLVVYDEQLRAPDPDRPPVDDTNLTGSGVLDFNTSSLYHLVITTQCAWNASVLFGTTHPNVP